MSRRVAVVTGASEGIGAAIAHRLVDDGYRVAMVARPSQRLTETVGELATAVPVGCDLTVPADMAVSAPAHRATCSR